MKEMKHDSSTIAWNAMGDEWFELAQTGESRNCFIMPNMLKFMGDVKDLNEPQASEEQAQISVAMAWLKKIPLYLYWELKK